MASFKDNNGKTWQINLDAPTISRVRKECSVNLVDVEGKEFERLADDEVLLVNTLWVLCSEQAKSDGVSDVQFGKALIGDAIELAVVAMQESIADFFRSSKRNLFSAIVEKNKRIREVGIAKAMERLGDETLEAKAIAAMEKRMDEELRKALTLSSIATDSQDS